MTFQDRLEIATSEGVTVSLTIAGIGSRALAWLVDGLLVFGVEVALGFAASAFDIDTLFSAGLVGIAALLIPFAYVVGMETLNGGRTLGKMATGLKVVRTSGAAVGFGPAAVRALFVPVDFLAAGIGLVVMFANARSQRIGDLAARTVVIRDRLPAPTSSPPQGQPPSDSSRWEVSTVTEEEVGVIRSFLGRASSLHPERRAAYARDLRARIEPRVVGVDAVLSDEVFLARVVAEKSRD